MYFGGNISSTERDVIIHLVKIWTATDNLSILWKSDLSDKIKWDFFQVGTVSVLLYGCTIGTLAKYIEKKLEGNSTRMLRAVLNKSWKQHPTKQQLYGHLPPILQTINDEQDIQDSVPECINAESAIFLLKYEWDCNYWIDICHLDFTPTI